MKFIIDSRTPRLRQLIKHYNLLSAKLDSISIEHYKGSVGSFCDAVLRISNEMSVVANEIFGITGTTEAAQVSVESEPVTDVVQAATEVAAGDPPPKKKAKKKQPIKLTFQDSASMHNWANQYDGIVSWGSGKFSNTTCTHEYEGTTEDMARDAIDNFGAINCE